MVPKVKFGVWWAIWAAMLNTFVTFEIITINI